MKEPERHLIYFLERWISRKNNVATRAILRTAIYGTATIIFLYLIAFVISKIFLAGHALYKETNEFLHDGDFVAWQVALSILVIATILSALKNSEAQIVYGAIETVIAFIWILYSLSSNQSVGISEEALRTISLIIEGLELTDRISLESIPLGRLLLLAGGFLLLRRGIDNFLKGIPKLPDLIGLFK